MASPRLLAPGSTGRGRNTGKDELCLHRTAVAAFERVAGYWHMLPEYAQARKAIWAAVNPHTGKRRIDEAFPRELRAHTREHEMQIEFKNGSTWQVVGSDRYDSLVGSGPAGLVYSEWPLCNPNARAYLRPIIFENNGWQIFNGTPRGRNHALTSLNVAKKTAGAFGQVLTAEETGVFSGEQLDAERVAYVSVFGEEYGNSRFEQEYLCSFDAANLGAILARQIGIAEKQGRISDDVVYDPNGASLEISADIGHSDSSTWWFWQPQVGGYQIVDYDSGFGLDAEEWAERLFKRLIGRKLGHIWLPHDARAKTFAAKRTAVEIFISLFGAEHVMITPMTTIPDRINAARVLTPRVKWAATACEAGLNGLRSWSYEYNEDTKTFGAKPIHDWASHDGDGYSYGCVIMQQVAPPAPKLETIIRGLTVGNVHKVTLDEMWQMAPKSNGRI